VAGRVGGGVGTGLFGALNKELFKYFQIILKNGFVWI
jgi:hypothetical protein